MRAKSAGVANLDVTNRRRTCSVPSISTPETKTPTDRRPRAFIFYGIAFARSAIDIVRQGVLDQIGADQVKLSQPYFRTEAGDRLSNRRGGAGRRHINRRTLGRHSNHCQNREKGQATDAEGDRLHCTAFAKCSTGGAGGAKCRRSEIPSLGRSRVLYSRWKSSGNPFAFTLRQTIPRDLSSANQNFFRLVLMGRAGLDFFAGSMPSKVIGRFS